MGTNGPIPATKAKLRRLRKRRRLQQAVFDGKKPLEHHDILIVPPKGVYAVDEVVRFPVVKLEGVVNQGEIDEGDEVKGTYVDSPEVLDAYDYAQRRLMAVNRPQDWGPEELRNVERGPAFGTLPVKREPAATSCAACYLINAQHLEYRNAWIAEEWTDIGGVDLPPAPSADDKRFEVLIAGPRGAVFELVVELDETMWPIGQKCAFQTEAEVVAAKGGGSTPYSRGSLTNLDLRYEMEIWNQLRNGAVYGRVSRRHRPKTKPRAPQPLVNITSLLPAEPADPVK